MGCRSGTWDDVVGGTTEYDFVFTYGLSDYSEDDMVNNRVEGVFGLLTNPDHMPVAGGAEFFGMVEGLMYDAADAERFWHLVGNVTLDVDFESGTLDGDITNFNVEGNAGHWLEFGIVKTNIAEGQFQTELTLNDDVCANLFEATLTPEMTGAFYGPVAEEAGGNLTMTLSEPEGALVFNGSFVAAQ
ncbi:MAG: transferrin-binding protein-like solute binding protein [Yoonia sp.]